MITVPDLTRLALDPAMPPRLRWLLGREPVRRPGHIAVSGCRPPHGPEATPSNKRIFEAICADVTSWARGLADRATLVHGGAEGVDITAADAAIMAACADGRALVVEPHRPLWAAPGTPNAQRRAWNRRAPMVRNAYVLTCEKLVAWPAPWSRGTWGAIDQRLGAFGAEGLEVRLVGWSGRLPASMNGLEVTYVE